MAMFKITNAKQQLLSIVIYNLIAEQLVTLIKFIEQTSSKSTTLNIWSENQNRYPRNRTEMALSLNAYDTT